MATIEELGKKLDILLATMPTNTSMAGREGSNPMGGREMSNPDSPRKRQTSHGPGSPANKRKSVVIPGGMGYDRLIQQNQKLEQKLEAIIEFQNRGDMVGGAGPAAESGLDGQDGMCTRADLVGVAGEFVATMLFLFIGVGAACANGIGSNPGFLLPSFAFGLGITVLAFVFGPVSCAHINPAVTLAALLCGKMKPLIALLYVVAQLVGAIVGAAVVLGGLPGDSDGAARTVMRGATNYVRTDRGFTRGDAFLYESFGTFLLVFTVLRTAVDEDGNHSVGPAGPPLAIGLAVFLAHLVLVPATNCSINPARSFGPAVVADKWDDHYIFWAGPITGSLFAVLFYKLLFASGKDNIFHKEPSHAPDAAN